MKMEDLKNVQQLVRSVSAHPCERKFKSCLNTKHTFYSGLILLFSQVILERLMPYELHAETWAPLVTSSLRCALTQMFSLQVYTLTIPSQKQQTDNRCLL